MKPQIKRQTTKPDSQSQQIQSEPLSFSCRQPHQLQRKLFIANFNLTSSTSFNKIKQSSNRTQRKQNFVQKIKKTKVDSLLQQKARKITEISLNVKGLQKIQNLNNQIDTEVCLTSQNCNGFWIKPKISYRKQTQSYQQYKKQSQGQKDSKYQSSQNQQAHQKKQEQNQNGYFSTFFRQQNGDNQFQQFLLDNQSYLNTEDQLPYKSQNLKSTEIVKNSFDHQNDNYQSQKKNNLFKAQSLKSQIQQSKKTLPNKVRSPKKQNIKLHESLSLQHSFLPTNKIKRNFRFSSQQEKAQKKYSKFKDLLKQQKQKRHIQSPKNIQTRQNKYGQKGNRLHDSHTKDSIQQKNKSKQELQPSHFSYKSPNNYIKKYLQLTANPQKFMKSLNELMQGNDGYEEHEYFKFQKMQKKMMYYKSNPNLLKQPRKFNLQNSLGSESQKQRKINYDNFVNGLKSKHTSRQKQTLRINKNQIALTQSLNSLPSLNTEHHDNKFQQKNLLSQRPPKQKVSHLEFSKTSFQYLSPVKKQNVQIPSINQQNILQNKFVKLEFRKKQNKIKRLQEKLQRIRSIQKQFSQQNAKIDHQFFIKKTQRLERSKSKGNHTKR